MHTRKLVIREYIRQRKDVPCADCGHRYPPACMEFDHITGEKDFSIGSSAGQKLRTIEAVANEIDKCEIVCANCHRLRHIQRDPEPEQYTMKCPRCKGSAVMRVILSGKTPARPLIRCSTCGYEWRSVSTSAYIIESTE